MAEHRCETCPMRANYDRKPKSFGSRFWRWHINWCPGWKSYFTSLPAEEKVRVAEQYDFRKYP